MPVLQQINIKNPLSKETMARVFLKPINLMRVAELIKNNDKNQLSKYIREIICS